MNFILSLCSFVAVFALRPFIVPFATVCGIVLELLNVVASLIALPGVVRSDDAEMQQRVRTGLLYTLTALMVLRMMTKGAGRLLRLIAGPHQAVTKSTLRQHNESLLDAIQLVPARPRARSAQNREAEGEELHTFSPRQQQEQIDAPLLYSERRGRSTSAARTPRASSSSPRSPTGRRRTVNSDDI